MFRLPPGLFRLGRPMAFTSNVFNPLKSSVAPKPSTLFSQIRNYRSLTWKRYNRHYKLNNINWQLLAKPALFTAGFCVTTAVVLPPLFKYPPFSTIFLNSKIVLYGIIAANVAGFLAWRLPATSRFMSRYGLLLKDNVRSNWSLLGSAFSHQDGLHLLFNMFMLHSFGSTIAAFFGPAYFLSMYLNSAVFSSFISLAIPTIMRSSLATASLGASGAVFSVFGTFCYLFPKASIGFFFIPIPGGAWFAFLGTAAFNVAGMFMKWGRYDYAAHLGGCVAGIFYGWWYKTRAKEQSRRFRVLV